jgi:hypothetical protein
MDCRWKYTLSDSRQGVIPPSGPWKCFAVKEKWVDLSCYIILHRTSYLHGEVMSRWNSERDCFHSVQSLRSCFVILKNFTKNLRNKTVLVWLCDCAAWADILWEEHRLRVSEKDMEQQSNVNLFLPVLSTAIMELHEGQHNWWASPELIKFTESRTL